LWGSPSELSTMKSGSNENMHTATIGILSGLILSSCVGCTGVIASMRRDSTLASGQDILAWIGQRHSATAFFPPEPCIETAYLKSGLALHGRSDADGACHLRSELIPPLERGQLSQALTHLNLLCFPPGIYAPPDAAYREVGVLLGDRYVIYGWTEHDYDLPRFVANSGPARVSFSDAWKEAIATLPVPRDAQAMAPGDEREFLAALDRARLKIE